MLHIIINNYDVKVLFISKYAKPLSSPVPSRQFFFSRNLVQKGHEVMMVYSRSNGGCNPSFKGKYFSKNEGGVITVMLQGPLIGLGMNFLRIWSWMLFEFRLFETYRLYKKYQPDIVIVSSLSILTFIFGVFIKKFLKKPLVIEVRDLYPLTLTSVGQMSRFNLLVIIIGWIEKFGYKNADAIISSLENAGTYFSNRIKRKVNFYWLPMGFDRSLYEKNVDQFSSQIIENIIKLKADGKFIVCYAGTIGKANALDNIFEVANDNEILEMKIEFVIIGDGPMKKYYSEKFDHINIHMFNPVDKKYLPYILKECHLLYNSWLNLSLYSHGISPNKWIEYMFSGRPLLLSFNYQSKIFEDGQFGWQIPAQNSCRLKKEIIRIYSLNRQELDIKGLNGRYYLESNLNYQSLSDKLESIIETCIK